MSIQPTRRKMFVGVCLATIGAILTAVLGVSIDSAILDTMADSWVTIITAGITLWGVLLAAWGQIKKGRTIVAGIKG